MKNKADKSLEEVWEMKAAAHDKFLNSGFSNYAEYLKYRQEQIDEIMNQQFNKNLNYVAV